MVPDCFAVPRSLGPEMSIPRSRLVVSDDVVAALDDLARELDARGADLWAANLRACMRWSSTGARLEHAARELRRLAESPTARREGLRDRVVALRSHVEVAVGSCDDTAQPVYEALHDLVDYLELEGGHHWARRLRAAAAERTVSGEALAAELTEILSQFEPGVPGVPPGGSQRARAACARLAAQLPGSSARLLRLALAPPSPRDA